MDTKNNTYISIENAVHGLQTYGGTNGTAQYLAGVLQNELDNPSGKKYLHINPIKMSREGLTFSYIKIEGHKVSMKLINCFYEDAYPGHIDHWTNSHK